MVIFDFNNEKGVDNWRVVDDVVMGGRSNGNFTINESGHGVFSGYVSLENNGGFSSVRYRFDQKKVADYSTAVIRLKGDGKRYQFRLKTDSYDQHSYISYFETSGDWETIEIPLQDMYPSFRGRRLRMANYPVEYLQEVTFLIANKIPEEFRLELDYIHFK
jgi:NADH dehydrogenase [ubiquinone] 1 alpha subcomplex assembly factor 1